MGTDPRAGWRLFVARDHGFEVLLPEKVIEHIDSLSYVVESVDSDTGVIYTAGWFEYPDRSEIEIRLAAFKRLAGENPIHLFETVFWFGIPGLYCTWKSQEHPRTITAYLTIHGQKAFVASASSDTDCRFCLVDVEFFGLFVPNRETGPKWQHRRMGNENGRLPRPIVDEDY
jgi:hypothetical protein